MAILALSVTDPKLVLECMTCEYCNRCNKIIPERGTGMVYACEIKNNFKNTEIENE